MIYVDCPYRNCDGEVDVSLGVINAETYGNKVFAFTCPDCGGKLYVGLQRSVQITNIQPAPSSTENSFSE